MVLGILLQRFADRATSLMTGGNSPLLGMYTLMNELLGTQFPPAV